MKSLGADDNTSTKDVEQRLRRKLLVMQWDESTLPRKGSHFMQLNEGENVLTPVMHRMPLDLFDSQCTRAHNMSMLGRLNARN